MIPPLLFLGVMLALTAFAWTAHKAQRHLRKNALRKLANEWQMRYLPEDRFDLTRRLMQNFPVVNATDLRVIDLIYATDADAHRYVFTAEYTAALDAGHRRERAVMTVCEPKEHAADALLSPPVTAPDDLSVVEQYAYLRSRGWACG